ncbi:MAG TPA: ATP-binding protein [Gaiellaceae bacterium]|nr:ATP-binding protein [Gaiellaceae bacterium]
MTLGTLRLPAAFASPATPAPAGRGHVKLRLGLFLAAWAAVSLAFLDWRALPFQALVAVAVLWHAIRRERLLADALAHQLHAADERHAELIETLPLATYVRDLDEDAVWVSEQIADLSSYSAAEWVADPHLFERLLHPDDRERILGGAGGCDSRGPIDREYRLVRRDGEVVWVHDTAVVVDGHGKPFRRGFLVDVTARREAELELERQNAQLREIDRMKDQFVALVSHELRTPLTSIRGYLELLAEDGGALSEEQLHFLATIDRNAQRLQGIVGDLLFCAQVESGRFSLSCAPVELASIVAESVEAARPAADGRDVALVVVDGAVPPVSGDRARLAQVVDNFVCNAVKFTGSGGTVTVATRLAGGRAELEISDTGMGIPADELPHLFERFFRAERATTKSIPGTGLGLTISQAIVDAHGGAIEVSSEEGVGTSFRIRLPLAG